MFFENDLYDPPTVSAERSRSDEGLAGVKMASLVVPLKERTMGFNAEVEKANNLRDHVWSLQSR